MSLLPIQHQTEGRGGSAREGMALRERTLKGRRGAGVNKLSHMSRFSFVGGMLRYYTDFDAPEKKTYDPLDKKMGDGVTWFHEQELGEV